MSISFLIRHTRLTLKRLKCSISDLQIMHNRDILHVVRETYGSVTSN
jgi:hypothetical protein